MSNVTVCVRFRPLSHKERKANGDNVCFRKLDSESFVFKVWTLFSLLPLAFLVKCMQWIFMCSLFWGLLLCSCFIHCTRSVYWISSVIMSCDHALLNINLLKHHYTQLRNEHYEQGWNQELVNWEWKTPLFVLCWCIPCHQSSSLWSCWCVFSASSCWVNASASNVLANTLS